MDSPEVPQKFPYIVDETPGKKAWCSCGRSKKQPYCDGSHKGTSFTPVIVEIEAPKKVAWCGCKFTGRPPFCDGSHSDLP